MLYSANVWIILNKLQNCIRINVHWSDLIIFYENSINAFGLFITDRYICFVISIYFVMILTFIINLIYNNNFRKDHDT